MKKFDFPLVETIFSELENIVSNPDWKKEDLILNQLNSKGAGFDINEAKSILLNTENQPHEEEIRRVKKSLDALSSWCLLHAKNIGKGWQIICIINTITTHLQFRIHETERLLSEVA